MKIADLSKNFICEGVYIQERPLGGDFLVEATFPRLRSMANPDMLPYTNYEPELKEVALLSLRNGTMIFRSKGAEAHESTLIFDDWERAVRSSKKPQEAASELLKTSNIRMHCDCKAFLFYGHQYIATQANSAIYPENRYPTIKNPDLKNVACKHLRRILRILPFYRGDIAGQIKRERSGASEQQKSDS
jgi:hypothetical protein